MEEVSASSSWGQFQLLACKHRALYEFAVKPECGRLYAEGTEPLNRQEQNTT